MFDRVDLKQASFRNTKAGPRLKSTVNEATRGRPLDRRNLC